jgi:hypothetical protein
MSGLATERTALAARRTLLSVVANGALLFKFGPVGWTAGALVLLLAGYVYALARRVVHRSLPVGGWAGAVVAIGLADIVTILLGHR